MASDKVTAAVTPATTTCVPMRTGKGISTMPQIGFGACGMNDGVRMFQPRAGLWTSKWDALCAPLYTAVVHGGVHHMDSAKIYEVRGVIRSDALRLAHHSGSA